MKELHFFNIVQFYNMAFAVFLHITMSQPPQAHPCVFLCPSSGENDPNFASAISMAIYSHMKKYYLDKILQGN